MYPAVGIYYVFMAGSFVSMKNPLVGLFGVAAHSVFYVPIRTPYSGKIQVNIGARRHILFC